MSVNKGYKEISMNKVYRRWAWMEEVCKKEGDECWWRRWV